MLHFTVQRALEALGDVAPKSSSSIPHPPVDYATITEPVTIFFGRLERGMVKTQEVKDGLCLIGLSRLTLSPCLWSSHSRGAKKCIPD